MKSTIKEVGYIPITEGEETGSLTYGDIIYFATAEAGGREYSATPKGEIQKIYANGTVAYACENNAGYEITLTLLSLIDDVDVNWYGKTKVNSKYKGIAEYANRKGNMPKFALIIHEETTDGKGKITFFPYCQVSARQSKSGKTSEEGNFDFAYSQHSLLASPHPISRLACFEFEGNDKLTEVPDPNAEAQTTNEQSGQGT